MVQAEVLWEIKTSKPFLTLTYGKLFQEDPYFIVTGGEDGVIQVYETPTRRAKEIQVSNEQGVGKRTPAFKLSVVEYAQKVGNAAAARRYDISESTIRSWRKSEPKLRKEAVLEKNNELRIKLMVPKIEELKERKGMRDEERYFRKQEFEMRIEEHAIKMEKYRLELGQLRN